MGFRDAEGFLGVIFEVGLGVHACRLGQDVHRILVGAHRAVAAETPEFAAEVLSAGNAGDVGRGQRQMGDVVVDADRKAFHRLFGSQIVEDCQELIRVGILGGEAVAAADDAETPPRLDRRRADVLEQRFAHRTHFLAAVQHRDALNARRDRLHQFFRGKRPVQVYLHEPDLAAVGVEVVDREARHAADGTHGDDDVRRLRVTVVVEQMVVPSGEGVDLPEIFLHHAGHRVVEAVVGFADLEVNVRVLHGVAQHGVFGVQGGGLESSQRLPVHHIHQRLFVDHLHCGELVARAETVEEVHERQAAFQRGQMRHGGQVQDLLHAARGEHGEAAGAAVHHVAVIAEDAHGVGAYGTGRHVHDRGKPFARDAVHDRDHQHQALAGGKGRGEGARLQRAVHRADGAGFALHLLQPHGLPEQILPAGRGPHVGMLRHGQGRRDRIDRCDLRKVVSYAGGSFVAVHGHQRCFLLFRHSFFLFFRFTARARVPGRLPRASCISVSCLRRSWGRTPQSGCTGAPCAVRAARRSRRGSRVRSPPGLLSV